MNEAMAAGLPVLVSNRCGCAVDLCRPGENGFIFPPHRVQAITDVLVRMSSLDRSSRSRMGTRSQEIIASYTPHLWARAFFKIAIALKYPKAAC